MKLLRKKKIIQLLFVVVATIFTFLLNGCSEDALADGVSFVEDTVSIEKYETYTMELLGWESTDVTWKSEDKSIATIEDGVVYAKKKGSTTISATKGKASISCEVVVTDNQYVPVIELNEPEEGINLVKKEEYELQPVISYNGNTYTDVKYEYNVDGDGLKVNKSGVIQANELGDATVCVKATWRDNVIETSIPISVLDASTSIEVRDKNFEIYLNGEGGEWPAQADLGIEVFDNKAQVKNPHASVTYIEKPEEGDVEGAAIIKNGIVYARKLGTTHFVAEYHSSTDALYYSTTFSVTVLKTPADIYMTPIFGEEFEFFWQPVGEENTVEWDETLQAFHLINKATKNNDTRGFIIDKDYLANILKYTKAESISFEFMTDGSPSGLVSDDKHIYQGFYPNWYVKDQIMMEEQVSKWKKVEIFFEDIPLDQEGNLKTIFLMNTTEGLYVRNITLWLPGEDRTGYDPNHNYLEDIRGTEYEFFIETLGSNNSVAWDEELQAYHLINKETRVNDTRGFIFNKDYLMNIIKHTNAESISFEFRTDGIGTGVDTKDQSIYQGFYPNWYDKDNMERHNLSNKWTKVEIFFDNIPLDEEGKLKTVFLLNTVEGMYIRNIKLYQPGDDRTGYDASHDYMEEIKGTEYEFFIEPLGNNNSVAWDSAQEAYHLTNKETRVNDTRGFIFNKDYLTNIVKHTKAESISFEFKTDGISSGVTSEDKGIYQGFYPKWSVKGSYTRHTLLDKWVKVEIFFDDIPLDEDGNMKTIFLMNTVEGMYVRNIKLHEPGDDRTEELPDYNYLSDIKGEEYEFFIEPLNGDNSVAWDETLEAYHLTNTVAKQDNTRGFIFNKQYLEGIIANTDAESISFEYKSDGIASGAETEDRSIYQSFWPDWWDTRVRTGQLDEWTQAEIKLDEIPLDTDGSIKTIFLMNTVEGMYVRNIKVNLPSDEPTETPVEYMTVAEINLADTAHTWSCGAGTGLTGGNGSGNYTREGSVITIPEARVYAVHEVQIAKAITCVDDMKIRFKMKATPNQEDIGNLSLRFFNIDTEGGLGTASNACATYTFTSAGEWETVELDLNAFLDADKNFKGFAVGLFFDGNSNGRYTVAFDKVELLGTSPLQESTKINLADTSHTWSCGAGTGLTGGNGSGNYTREGSVITVPEARVYAVHKVTLSEAQTWEEGLKIRFKVRATPKQDTASNLTVRFFNHATTGGLGTASNACAIYEITKQGEWETVELNLDSFLNDENKFLGFSFGFFFTDDSNGRYTLEFDQIEISGVPVQEEAESTKINLADTTHTWSCGAATGLTGGNGSGNYTREGSVITVPEARVYAVHKVTLSEAQTWEEGLKIRFKVRATPKQDTASNLTVRFFNHATTGGLGTASNACAIYEITQQGEWETVELNLDSFLNDENKFLGFSFGFFFTDDSNGRYTLEFDQIEIY